jgi:transcriptional regulator
VLTEKELEVLRRRADGEQQQQIARSLGISQAAVSKFETNAQRKIIEAMHLLDITRQLGLSLEEGLAAKRILYQGKERRRGGGTR